MKEYLILFFIVSIALVVEMRYSTIKIGSVNVPTRKLSFYVISAIIVILGVFKSENYGYDAGGYKDYCFDLFTDISISEAFQRGIEPGFALLSFLVCKITSQYWVYRTVFFLMIFSGMSYVIWKKSSNIALSYLIYISFGFLSFDFFILRQALAATIIFMGFFSLERKKYGRFVVAVIAATFFHYTAVLAFALMPLAIEKFHKTRILKRFVYLVGIFAGGMFFSPILFRMYSRIRGIDYAQNIISGEGYGMLFILLLFWWGIDIIQNKYLNGKQMDEERHLFEYGMGSVYIQVISLFFSLFNRTIYYALAYALICVPNMCEKLNIKTKRTVAVILWLMMLLMFYKTILCSDVLIPYVWL